VPVELNAKIGSPLPDAVEIAAYYVVSEALTNVAKYASASLVRVDVTTDDKVLTLAVRDDGIGGAVLGGGSGLVGLQDRVEALAGTVEIDSPPGRGTSVVAMLPITAESALQHERAIRPPHERSRPIGVSGRIKADASRRALKRHSRSRGHDKALSLA
jgi:glucose-6-phosphate-specific signal transduction histidine kinase